MLLILQCFSLLIAGIKNNVYCNETSATVLVICTKSSGEFYFKSSTPNCNLISKKKKENEKERKKKERILQKVLTLKFESLHLIVSSDHPLASCDRRLANACQFQLHAM